MWFALLVLSLALFTSSNATNSANSIARCEGRMIQTHRDSEYSDGTTGSIAVLVCGHRTFVVDLDHCTGIGKKGHLIQSDYARDFSMYCGGSKMHGTVLTTNHYVDFLSLPCSIDLKEYFTLDAHGKLSRCGLPDIFHSNHYGGFQKACDEFAFFPGTAALIGYCYNRDQDSPQSMVDLDDCYYVNPDGTIGAGFPVNGTRSLTSACSGFEMLDSGVFYCNCTDSAGKIVRAMADADKCVSNDNGQLRCCSGLGAPPQE